MEAAQYYNSSRAIIGLTHRQWPTKTLQAAPQWCSLDLSEGNYSLDTPLITYRRDTLLALLLKLGLHTIAFGNISKNKIKADYIQQLFASESISSQTCIELDTTMQEENILNTLETLRLSQNARVRLCVPTSTRLQELLLKCDKQTLLQQTVQAAHILQQRSNDMPGLHFGFCLEDFSASDLAYTVDICHAVLDVWQANSAEPIIISLPNSTDCATPNRYADQIEWFCQHINNRDKLLISLYAANDRATAVAAIELGLLAGGQRVEGSLFGNGERTGCAALITLALNMLTQGIDPQLAINHMDEINEIVQTYTQQRLGSRYPYSGDLVFTTLDESQRLAIKAGLLQFAETKQWNVPYAIIDPSTLGKRFNLTSDISKLEQQYEPASILEEIYSFHLPKTMRLSFNNAVTDMLGEDTTPQKIKKIFYQTYVENNSPLVLKNINFSKKALYGDGDEMHCDATIAYQNEQYHIEGVGNGPIDTLINALKTHLHLKFDVAGYAQHSLTQSSSGLAVTYIRVIDKDSGNGCWGVGIDSEGTLSSVKALINAINRCFVLNNWIFKPEKNHDQS